MTYSLMRQMLTRSLLCVRHGVHEAAQRPVGIRRKERLSQGSAVSVAVSVT